MRCPKCHYLSFDPEPRCKNCGYDLEVAGPEPALKPAAKRAAAPLPDLKLRETPTATALAERYTMVREPADDVQDEPEIQLRDHDYFEDAGDARAEEVAEVTEVAEETPVAPVAAKVAAVAQRTVEAPADQELPDEDDFMIRQFPISRPPLAVRRPAAEPPRAAARKATERRPGPLDLDLLEDLRRVEREEADLLRADAHAIGANLTAMTDAAERVEPRQRALAALIDVAVLGGIAAFVFWATLRLVDVNLFDLPIGALVPLVLFLVMMDVGYLLMFTAAGGQTIGKMLMGIRVVCEDGGPAFVSVRQAAWRAVLTVLSLGLAWLPALTGRGLALHDRISHTRVIRA